MKIQTKFHIGQKLHFVSVLDKKITTVIVFGIAILAEDYLSEPGELDNNQMVIITYHLIKYNAWCKGKNEIFKNVSEPIEDLFISRREANNFLWNILHSKPTTT